MQFFSTFAVIGAVCIAYVTGQFTLYDFWLHPGGEITRHFDHPQNDPNSSGVNEAEISALMTTSDAQHLLRNLVSDSPGPNTWIFQAGYAPDPQKALSNSFYVYPGQAITSLFRKDIVHNLWQDTFTIQNVGAPVNHPSVSNNVQFDPSTVPTKPIGPFTEAFFTVDLRGSDKWNYGSVTWNNVIVQAFTQDSAWCTSLHFDEAIDFAYTTPVATHDGDTTICYIERLSLTGPK